MGKSSWACPACGKTLREGAATPETGSAPFAPLLARAQAGEESLARAARFTRSALLCAAGGPVVAGLSLLARASDNAVLSTLGLLGLLGGGLAGLTGILKLLGEALQRSIHDRSTPSKALKAYLTAIELGRWDAALTCLSWVARDGEETVRPAITPVELPAERVKISSVDDLRAYWAPIRGGLSSLRTFTWTERDCRVEGDTAQIRADFRVVIDTRGLSVSEALKARLALKRNVTATFCAGFPLYRRHERWYLLTAGLPADTPIAEA